MINCWTWSWCTCWYYSHFFACRVNWTTTNMPYQCSWIFKSSWRTNLFDLIAYWEHPDVWLLSPADDIVVHDLKSTYFSLTLRESESLLDLTSKTKHVESIISGDDECIFGNKKTSKCFLIYWGNTRDGKIVVSFSNFQDLYLFTCPIEQFVSNLIKSFDMSWCCELFSHFIFVILIRNLYLICSFQNGFEITWHSCWYFCLTYYYYLITLFTHNNSIIFTNRQCLNLFSKT